MVTSQHSRTHGPLKANRASPSGRAVGRRRFLDAHSSPVALVSDCMSYMQTPQPGISVKCVDDNVFVWQVKLSDFPADSQMQKDLLQLQSIYNYAYVEIEIRFMMDLYPFFPPSVRLVRPRMKVRNRRRDCAIVFSVCGRLTLAFLMFLCVSFVSELHDRSASAYV